MYTALLLPCNPESRLFIIGHQLFLFTFHTNTITINFLTGRSEFCAVKYIVCDWAAIPRGIYNNNRIRSRLNADL